MIQSTTKSTKWRICQAEADMGLRIDTVWSVFAVRSNDSKGSKVISCLITLGESSGWYESLLGAQVIFLTYSGSYLY